MKLIKESVNHGSFGAGKITDISDRIVTVRFKNGEKKFLYPDAFFNFLTLVNETKQKEIYEICNQKLRDKELKRKAEREEEERLRELCNLKISPNSQAAFHIELTSVATIVESGAISTGYYLSGYSKGEPRIPVRIQPNSVCLLTGVEKGDKEKNRRIVGVFMVKEDFLGQQCKDGIVPAHDKFRVCLPDDATIHFWDYFKHEELLHSWGRVPFKYVPNTAVQKILLAIGQLFNETEQESLMNEFYQYYCNINHLPTEQISNAEKF